MLSHLMNFVKKIMKEKKFDKTKYDIKKPISNNIDAAYCPNCNSKLKYKFYHYGHIGSYTCPREWRGLPALQQNTC